MSLSRRLLLASFLSLCAACDARRESDTAPLYADVPATPETLCPTGPDRGGGDVHDWVISRLIVDDGQDPPGTRGYHGFDLDDRFSSSTTPMQTPLDCNHGDFFSTLDPDQNMGSCSTGSRGGGSGCRGGVDNQLPMVAQVMQQLSVLLDLQRMYDDGIASGALAYLLRVEGVNGTLGPLLNDPSVTVRVYPRAWPAFADCSRIAAPGQTWQVDDRDLAAAGDLSSAVLTFHGCIVDGRLRVEPRDATGSGLPLPLFARGTSVRTVDLLRSTFRVNLSGVDRNDGGNLGGWVRECDMFDALTSVPDVAPFEESIGYLVNEFVDVATTAGDAGLSCTRPEGGISVGVGFEMVRAVIAPTTTAGRPAGTCAR